MSIARPQPGDAEARERIRFSLDESLVVEASAGTGKTTELIQRIVNTLRSGRAAIPGVVAVTFTNKAAGEMKLRLRQELDRARQSAAGGEARNLEDALERLEEAAIGTIHSFCGQILRERPVEAQVDPAFREAADGESWRLYQRVFRRWIQTRLNESSPGLRRALCRLAWKPPGLEDDESPLRALEYAGWQLVEWRDFDGNWEHVPFDRDSEVERMVEWVREAAGRMSRSIAPVHELVDWVSRAEAIGQRDCDTLEALLVRLLGELSAMRGPGVEKLLEQLRYFQREADADLASALRGELWSLVEDYEQTKRQAGMLDFHDLLVMTRNLIRDNRDVRAYLQQRYTHLYVDEFQDTDPLQAEILLLLAAGDSAASDWRCVNPKPGKLFVVGDPKQSIYKFRRADVVLYESVRQQLAAHGVATVYLTRSYRAVGPIQELVNAAFEPHMQGEPESGQARYAPLEEHAPAIAGQPAVVALPAPRPYGRRNISKESINACLPEAVVAFTEWLVRESGWKVRDPEQPGHLTPVSLRHVCLLFRRMTNFGRDVAREYAKHFEARGLPHLLVGSKSFHRREEVETVRMALTAIEWPDDELAVFATLKGALFALTDAELFVYRSEVGRLHPFRPATGNPAHERIEAALALLGDLHRRRNRRPVAETVNLLLEATRAHAGFALRPAGQQVLANVHRIGDLAREYEAQGGISFRGFVDHLDEEARRTETQEAPVLEEGADGVRLMTVHKAKGLEFPVVILADMTANLSRREPERHVDATRRLCAMQLLWCMPRELRRHQEVEKRREEAEGVRVAYVAATRARDLLVVPVVGDEERKGWLEPLNAVVYPPADRRRFSQPAEGCPQFGEVTVLNRPFEPYEEFSVRPGRHAPRKGTHEVVWWDPGILTLGVEVNEDSRQTEILAAGSARSAERYAAWVARRSAALSAGARPEFTVARVTELTDSPPVEIPVEWHYCPRAAPRPAGRRFGTLVHAVLRDVELTAEPERVKAVVALHARLLGATAGEIDGAVHAVEEALRHPVLIAAQQANRCEREWPLIFRQGERLVEGVVDLAYLNGGCWQVVDFKTDEDLSARRAHYETQVKWYAVALSAITGLPARAVLLAV
jgi:ATP-dependent exoDNAse (exonuclease V) beta subunit